MLKLRTVFPFGLNDRVDEYQREEKNCVARKFPSLKRNFERLSRGNFRQSPRGPSHEIFFRDFNQKLKTSIKDSMNFARMSLSSMKKSELKRVASLLTDQFSIQDKDFKYSQWYTACIDIIESRLFKETQSKKKKGPPSNPCRILFDNKAVEIINPARIFKSLKVVEAVPSVAKTFQIPTIIYSLKEPVGSKIFNFNKFSSSLDVKSFLKDSSILPCSCSDSEFRDPHHKHIITGDLNIVDNIKLRKLFSRGPKYREAKQLDFAAARGEISKGIDDCIENYCQRHHLDKVVLKAWRTEVLKAVDDRIREVLPTIKCDPVSEVLKDPECHKALLDLQNRFVICPIDKATGNISLICKRFYAEVLVQELGLKNTRSETYQSIRRQGKTIIQGHKRDLKSKFGIAIPEFNEKLPNIYWLPKLHKKPLKFRFIIAAPSCSVKPLSKAITSVFKMFYNQIERYNMKCCYYSSVKTFWVIQNNQDVLNSLKKLNKRGKASCISTFDFSTLYTKIPHDKLLFVLNELTDVCFNGGNRELISVTKSGARWVTKPSSHGITFTKSTLKEAIKYLMENCFFTLGDRIFRQTIGIPMGSDPAPFMANLFLYYYESNYVKKVKKKDIFIARKFRHTYRFIDDLLAVNDDGEFEKCFKDIYPEELELKKEHGGENVAFLDLSISMKGRLFQTSLYDKRDNFPFSIVRMPFKSSNIPSKIFYSTIGAEILRIGRASSTTENFTRSAKLVLKRMLHQGADPKFMTKVLKRAYGRHEALQKFNTNAVEFVKSLQ